MKTCPSCLAAYADTVAFCPRDGVPLRPAGALEPGTVIRNKYQIVNEIARGGMGVVYRARHLLWNEDKAIKLLLGVGAEGREHTAGILSEALVMRQFQHANIVRVEDADFTDDEKLFIVMEYVEGESLHQRMSRGPMPWEEALELAAQACAGLAAAHQKGIVHRDIKPQNLLLTRGADGGDVLKLIDFGIAKVREDAGLGLAGITTSVTGFFIGTPEYASPEQAMGMRGKELDARTDLYSLGLVMFEMLTGVRPFAADTLLATLMLRLQNEAVPPRQLRPELEIPQIVSDLVKKAIARERDSRYGSAEEMGLAIRDVLDRRQTLHARGPGPRQTGKTARNAIAASVAAAGAVALVWFFSHRPSPPRVSVEHPTLAPQAPAAVDRTPTAKPPDVPQRARKEPDPLPRRTAKVVAPAPPTNAPGVKVNPRDRLKYAWIPPGKFMMGCSPEDADCFADEGPAHEVTITRGFWMGETEVTQAAWERVIGNNPSNFKGANLPVESVNWFQANSYCRAVGMRLPTEAEWEYAARGATSASRYGNPGQIAWWRANSERKTHEVAQKEPNGYGLYDVLGNVSEWTADWYGGYPAAAVADPHGSAEGQYRSVRGASWLGGLNIDRVSDRVNRKPGVKADYIGLRCAGE